MDNIWHGSFVNLRRFNDLLSLIIVALAIYIFLWPFLPAISWWAHYDAPIISRAPTVTIPAVVPKENTLIIPALEMTQQIHDGKGVDTLNKGVWHRPATSTPDMGKNTVLSAHRFTYSGKSVFYYLDKVKMNDKIYVYWEGKQYTYQVASIKEVPPTDTAVEKPTDQSVLTLYTCTPLWSAKNRLVIQANLVGSTP